MKNYNSYKVIFFPFESEIVSGLLWQLPIAGIVEETNELIVYSSNKIKKTKFLKILTKLVDLKILESFSVSVSTLKNKNWNEEWEKKIKIIKISDRVVVKPTFRKYKPKKNQIVITIDPKMSFGTGEHETTQLVIKALEKFVQQKDKILDVGTGTGILAIAAIKLGAYFALGIDNDDWCLENGLENVSLNRVEDKIQIKTGEIKNVKQKNFDIVVANIQKNVLMSISKGILSKVKRNGHIILSGLLDVDEQDIIAHYKNLGLSKVDMLQKNEWICLTFQNNN